AVGRRDPLALATALGAVEAVARELHRLDRAEADAALAARAAHADGDRVAVVDRGDPRGLEAARRPVGAGEARPGGGRRARCRHRRRMERSMALLRETDRPVTEICLDVGFSSLGSFSRTFSRVVGMSPSAYREAWRVGAGSAGYVPTCVVMSWTRPRGEPQD